MNSDNQGERPGQLPDAAIEGLEGAELDAAVAKAEGEAIDRISDDTVFVRIADTGGIAGYAPSRDWLRAGPIIERERITITAYMEREYCGLARANRQPWVANIQWDYQDERGSVRAWGAGQTPLIAAMRAYVASKT